jgi:hypothetical protein
VSCTGGSRGSHCEENTGRSGTRYGSHAATPGDSTPTAPQTRTRRPHDRMDIVPTNTTAPNPLEDVISSSKLKKRLVKFLCITVLH